MVEYRHAYIAGWRSGLSRWAHNPKNVGSNPTQRNTKNNIKELILIE